MYIYSHIDTTGLLEGSASVDFGRRIGRCLHFGTISLSLGTGRHCRKRAHHRRQIVMRCCSSRWICCWCCAVFQVRFGDASRSLQLKVWQLLQCQRLFRRSGRVGSFHSRNSKTCPSFWKSRDQGSIGRFQSITIPFSIRSSNTCEMCNMRTNILSFRNLWTSTTLYRKRQTTFIAIQVRWLRHLAVRSSPGPSSGHLSRWAAAR